MITIDQCYLMPMLAGDVLQQAPYQRRQPEEVPRRQGIAIVPLTASYIDAAVSFEVSRKLREAAAANVAEIILFCDCLGGSSVDSGRLAEVAAEVNSQVPITTFVAAQCTSGAYKVASQTSRIVASRHAVIGSIGTILLVADTEELYRRLGVKVWAIATGEHKSTGAPGVKITDGQLAELERFVRSITANFLSDVARGRKVSVRKVKDEWATGSVWVSLEAAAMGLIDGVMRWEALVADVVARSKAMHDRQVTQDYSHLRGKAALQQVTKLVKESNRPLQNALREVMFNHGSLYHSAKLALGKQTFEEWFEFQQRAGRRR
ncbi:S49 family peptidase [Aeoliella sp.]|uniref:S49 family peptidase n=1 Tax=Aeoliella sp. TaxID=2795800 RepID=UPI003CCC12CF